MKIDCKCGRLNRLMSSKPSIEGYGCSCCSNFFYHGMGDPPYDGAKPLTRADAIRLKLDNCCLDHHLRYDVPPLPPKCPPNHYYNEGGCLILIGLFILITLITAL